MLKPIFKRETAKALIYDEESKKFLLTRFLLSKNYGFAGGGIKKNENIHEALRRELKEEINLDQTTIKKIIRLRGEEISRQNFLFFIIENKIHAFLIVVTKTPKLKLNWESGDCVWVELKNINKFLSQYYQNLFNKFVQNNEDIFRAISLGKTKNRNQARASSGK